MTPLEMARLHAAAAADRAWSATEFAALAESPFTVVAGDARSFALGRVIADEAELLTICTDPAFRRRGLAARRLAEFERLARWRGASQGFLEVAEDNDAARALYLAAGWRETGRRHDYYGRSGALAVDAVLMSKTLAE